MLEFGNKTEWRLDHIRRQPLQPARLLPALARPVREADQTESCEQRRGRNGVIVAADRAI